ncbi:MAG TPA: NAD(P)/FAD-dependent oxidoreductase [Gaiellaceae bacterium]|nr:NAD(P)/FAD-dependent oxidoreductase [Gaiellaceae bacterium]
MRGRSDPPVSRFEPVEASEGVSKLRCEIAVIGGGIAGLAALHHLRERDVVLLESEARLGGRIRSEPRDPYWLNLGPHVLPGPDTNLGRLLTEIGLETRPIPGTATAAFLNGHLVAGGHPETFLLRLRLPLLARLSLARAGATIRRSVKRYLQLAEAKPGEGPSEIRQRLLAFEDDRSFADLIGPVHADIDALLRAAINRVSAEPEELSAGAGVGQFAATFNGRSNLFRRNLPGGTSLLVDRLAAELSPRVLVNSRVTSIRNLPGGVLIDVMREGRPTQVQARAAIVATPAYDAVEIIADPPDALRHALRAITYGPYVVAALLTKEDRPMPWDQIYAIAVARKSFNMFFNTASLLRTKAQRIPGGSITVYGAATLAQRLLAEPDERVTATFMRDVVSVFPELKSVVKEVVIQRWPAGIPFSRPGRSVHQPSLETPFGNVILAGDYIGERGGLDTATTSGLEAAVAALRIVREPARQAQLAQPVRFRRTTGSVTGTHKP